MNQTPRTIPSAAENQSAGKIEKEAPTNHEKSYTLCAANSAMSVNAFALEVPTDTVVQNLNGSQQAIKTYTIPPDQDPSTLIEEPF